jgi:hypothetical protein
MTEAEWLVCTEVGLGGHAMTEAEWLVCTDPTLMLDVLGGKASERKLRLFVCACCRLCWHLLIDERSRAAIEAAETFSDGLLADAERQRAFSSACAASLDVRRSPDTWPETTLRLRHPHRPDKLWRASFEAAFAVGTGVGFAQAVVRAAEGNLVDRPMQSQLLCEIFGNPFRPVSADPAWLTWHDGTVKKLAEAIYNDRAFDRLPILADALEEAGCANTNILGHCRQPGGHVRGCWVVDTILGKK